MSKKRYYRLNIEKDPKIIGQHFPQISEIEGGFYYQIYELKNRTYIKDSVSKEYNLPNEVFLGIGKLKARTKLTSVLSDEYSLTDPNSSYLIVNEHTKRKLSQFNLGDHKFYNLPILHKKMIHKYYYLAINNPDVIAKNKREDSVDVFFKKEGIYQVMYFSENIWEEAFNHELSGLVIDKELKPDNNG